MQIGITAVQPRTGRGVINMVRPLHDAAGRRSGTMLARVDSERFERIYTLVELGEGGSVSLFHRDWTMLVRGPSLPSAIGRSFHWTSLFQDQLPVSERGAFETRSPIDGKARLYGYDADSNYPLVRITSLNTPPVGRAGAVPARVFRGPGDRGRGLSARWRQRRRAVQGRRQRAQPDRRRRRHHPLLF
jgi:hypothetical protein